MNGQILGLWLYVEVWVLAQRLSKTRWSLVVTGRTVLSEIFLVRTGKGAYGNGDIVDGFKLRYLGWPQSSSHLVE